MFNFIKEHPIWSAVILCLVIIFLLTPVSLIILVILIITITSWIIKLKQQNKLDSFVVKTTPKLNPNADQFMSAENKAVYLKSPNWYKLKQQAHTRDNNKCVICGSTRNLQAHHITYERLGDENLDDLATLCGEVLLGCHSKIHLIAGYDRTTKYPISILTNGN